ncbi:MAG: hypothetical protein ACOZF2_00580 [Thermodesulfobacteriota bacterium]
MNLQISGQQRQIFQIMVGFLLGMALLWFTGCARGDGVPRRLEADYGRSVINSRLEMMITPPNAVDPTPPVGMTPTAAANSQERYDKTFAPKEDKTSTLIVSPQSSQ